MQIACTFNQNTIICPQLMCRVKQYNVISYDLNQCSNLRPKHVHKYLEIGYKYR